MHLETRQTRPRKSEKHGEKRTIQLPAAPVLRTPYSLQSECQKMSNQTSCTSAHGTLRVPPFAMYTYVTAYFRTRRVFLARYSVSTVSYAVILGKTG